MFNFKRFLSITAIFICLIIFLCGCSDYSYEGISFNKADFSFTYTNSSNSKTEFAEEYEFKVGSKWHSTNPELTLFVQEDNNFATWIINGKKYEFVFWSIGDSILFGYLSEGFFEDSYEVCACATGNFSIEENGDMIIDDLYGDIEDFSFEYKKIVLTLIEKDD